MRTLKLAARATCTVTMLCSLTAIAVADEKRMLSDAELDSVTAGAASVTKEDELLTFEATKRTRSGKIVKADGNLKVIESLDGITIGNLQLNDNAQSNLQSIININAVNSAVNVLLNLNVTVDSSVGTLSQTNVNASLPPVTALPGN